MASSDDTGDSARSITKEDPSIPTTVLQARFGYVHPLKDAFFWFRTGFTYSFATDDVESTPGFGHRTSIRHYSIPIDFVFVFPFAKHFGITYGFSADLGMYGVEARESYGGDTPGTKSEERHVSDGVGMWFGVLGLL